MTILLTVILFFAGTFFIIKGGDYFIDASCWMSDVTGISKGVIGATIVSLATTSPEYFVSLLATLKGMNDLSIGNAVGSLICNIGIAFGLLALFTPGKVSDQAYGIKGAVMLLSTAMLWLFCLSGVVNVAEGLLLLLLFAVFTLVNIKYAQDGENKQKQKTNAKEVARNVVKFVGSAAAIVFGSNLIVDNGKVIASYLGVSDTLIGLTIVAIGTSLPEVVTSIAAIVKRESAMSIGNIIGANTIDATLILATGAFISGGKLSVSSGTVGLDIPVALVLMTAAVLPTAIGKRVYRWQGIFIAALYAVYLFYITFVRA